MVQGNAAALKWGGIFFFFLLMYRGLMRRPGITTRSAYVRYYGSAMGWTEFCRRRHLRGCPKKKRAKKSTKAGTSNAGLTIGQRLMKEAVAAKKAGRKTFKSKVTLGTYQVDPWPFRRIVTYVPKRTSTTSTKLTLSEKKKKYKKSFKHGSYRYTKKAGRWSREPAFGGMMDDEGAFDDDDLDDEEAFDDDDWV